MADPARMTQVLENLLGNAVKYTRATDAIRVSVRGEPEMVEIVVNDEGVGIEADDLPQVFDLFVQADVTLDRAQSGLGIGLAWVKRIVELHGGTVQAASAGRNCGRCLLCGCPARGRTPRRHRRSCQNSSQRPLHRGLEYLSRTAVRHYISSRRVLCWEDSTMTWIPCRGPTRAGLRGAV